MHSKQALKTKIGNIDVSDYAEMIEKRWKSIGQNETASNTDLFVVALQRCKTKDDILSVISEGKKHEELYSPDIYLGFRGTSPKDTNQAFLWLEEDLKDGKENLLAY